MMSDDFPDPETPVTTVIHSSGIRTFIFLRLFSFAPYISRKCFGFVDTGCFLSTFFRQERYSAVCVLDSSKSLYVHENNTSPPWTQAPGQMSMIWSDSLMISSSCSTTTTVFPIFARRLRLAISISLSLGWRPIDGSSRT